MKSPIFLVQRFELGNPTKKKQNPQLLECMWTRTSWTKTRWTRTRWTRDRTNGRIDQRTNGQVVSRSRIAFQTAAPNTFLSQGSTRSYRNRIRSYMPVLQEQGLDQSTLREHGVNQSTLQTSANKPQSALEQSFGLFFCLWRIGF